MRLNTLNTNKAPKAVPMVVKENAGYAVKDINGITRKLFDDIDIANHYMKRHNKELREGVEPVVYMSEIMEGVLDSTDDDGWMAKGQLYQLSKYSVELHGMIQDTDNLEPWVQAKITKAADYISAVKHYMEYLVINDQQSDAPVVIDDLPDDEFEI